MGPKPSKKKKKEMVVQEQKKRKKKTKNKKPKQRRRTLVSKKGSNFSKTLKISRTKGKKKKDKRRTISFNNIGLSHSYSSKETNDITYESDRFLQSLLSQEQPQNTPKRQQIKVLFLGCAESGKSTIIKNIKCHTSTRFSNEEKIEFRDAIRHNILSNMGTLLSLAKFEIKINFENDLHELIEEFNQTTQSQKPTNRIWTLVQKIWEYQEIQLIYYQKHKFSKSKYHLTESAEVFLNKVRTAKQPEFIPNTEEILKCYLPTTHIVMEEIILNEQIWKSYDVPGMREGRKQWPSVYNAVNLVCFVVALSEFDMSLRESTGENRLRDSLNEFSNICSSPWFTNTQIILLFNKIDIFKKKIKKVDLNTSFPEYNGDNSYHDAFEFIKSKFLDESIVGTYDRKRIQIYLVNALDLNSVSTTFNHISDKISVTEN
ncbi:guanine nucleotide-binding protein g(o) subunit alpha [Anaeramoeba flamelloides]|uniref:Guanine nucleotide-binding protein g(O) subunit alpha n=1 Tax=Anaeramoeba flamelloides TaxID=1746091 RepID=A0AAV7ZAY7_9EUKA|nr:guanine nucleotide-binding protein g(o) subunit alpha [Anaeramoeba flamelloides]